MIILGNGIDIVSIQRIRTIYNKYHIKFANRILSSDELKDYNNIHLANDKIYYLAKKFTLKEAVSKAIGCGIFKDLRWKDISTYKDKRGKPLIKKTQALCDIVRKLHHTSSFDFFISVSDEKNYAISNAILIEKDVVQKILN